MLGDRIAIMSHGEIKCLGTPLHLKNKYGDGYRLNVTARPDAVEEAKDYITELLPGTSYVLQSTNQRVLLISHPSSLAGANLVAETNQYLIFGLPHSQISQIVPFFKILERQWSEEGKDAIVTNCSISHTSTLLILSSPTPSTPKKPNLLYPFVLRSL